MFVLYEALFVFTDFMNGARSILDYTMMQRVLTIVKHKNVI